MLTIYNLLGQEIRRLVESPRWAGSHLLSWDGLDQRGQSAPTGIYYCRMNFKNHVAIRRMLLVR
jgi:flagellar hook assembly protein FlgD